MKLLISTSSFAVDDSPALMQLRQAGWTLTLNPYGRKLTEAEVTGLLADGVVGIIAGVETLSAAVLDAAPALKVISRVGAGLDSVDLEAAQRKGIRVSNTPDAPAPAVAEMALGLMLAVARSIPRADRKLRAGKWAKETGRLISGQTVGIVGLGRIGRRVAAAVSALGATVIGSDPVLSAEAAAALGIRLVSADEVFAQANIISLHCPTTAQTRHIVNARTLALVQPGTILINTARGELVDEAALLAALEDKRLSGVGLDVFEQEPYTGPLLGREDVVLTPHIGSAAVEVRTAMESEAVHNLLEGLRATGVVLP